MDEKLLKLWCLHPQVVDGIEDTAKSKWSRVYDEEGRCGGHMTTNLAESINSILKRVKFLSILGLVKATFYRLNYYWVEHAMTSHE